MGACFEAAKTDVVCFPLERTIEPNRRNGRATAESFLSRYG